MSFVCTCVALPRTYAERTKKPNSFLLFSTPEKGITAPKNGSAYEERLCSKKVRCLRYFALNKLSYLFLPPSVFIDRNLRVPVLLTCTCLCTCNFRYFPSRRAMSFFVFFSLRCWCCLHSFFPRLFPEMAYRILVTCMRTRTVCSCCQIQKRSVKMHELSVPRDI